MIICVKNQISKYTRSLKTLIYLLIILSQATRQVANATSYKIYIIMLLACLFPILLLPCILLILVVNYLMLRKQHSSWNHNCIIKILVVFLQTKRSYLTSKPIYVSLQKNPCHRKPFLQQGFFDNITRCHRTWYRRLARSKHWGA